MACLIWWLRVVIYHYCSWSSVGFSAYYLLKFSPHHDFNLVFLSLEVVKWMVLLVEKTKCKKEVLGPSKTTKCKSFRSDILIFHHRTHHPYILSYNYICLGFPEINVKSVCKSVGFQMFASKFRICFYPQINVS